jgi:predicted glycosyltransferase involved in capsule biosynthesis
MMPAISFCTTCRNRLWQIKQTLQQNLETIGDQNELVLVDYGSTDGLSAWVWENFSEYIEKQRLIFFEVTNEVRWNVARAKNLAHRLANGDFLFNLDADNFVDFKDLALIEKVRKNKISCWQWSGSFPDGSYGRIGTSKSVFKEIGGYDETMLAMGAQDYDLIKRLSKVQKIARLPAPSIEAVQNNDINKMSELKSYNDEENSAKADYNTFNLINSKISEMKLLYEGPRRVGGGFSYKGILNGEKIAINGFDEITSLN